MASAQDYTSTEQRGGELASQRAGAEIRIADFDFDLDKDGTVDPFEQKVKQALHAADTDGSGTLSPAEFIGVLKTMASTEKEKSSLGRQVGLLSGLVVLLIGALVGVSIVGAVVGGDSIKENRNPDCSDGAANPRCQPSGLVRVGSVESFVPSIYALPSMPTNQLAYLRDVTTYVDMATNTAIGGAVEATFKLAGAYKRSNSEVHLVTTNGYTISLNATAKTGTIAMGGSTYPVLEAPPSGGRRLEMEETSVGDTLSAKQLAEHHENRRELSANWGGALMTSGSFDMMASTSFSRRKLEETDRNRRELQNWGGALMTDGSFTMMASGGY